MFTLFVLTLASALNDCLFDAGAEVYADHSVRVCECFDRPMVPATAICVDRWLLVTGKQGVWLRFGGRRGAYYLDAS